MQKEFGSQMSYEERMDMFTTVKINAIRDGNNWKLTDKSGHTHRLTDREYEVLELICKYAYKRKELSEKLRVGKETVRNYLSRITSEFLPKEPYGNGSSFENGTTKWKLILHLREEGILEYLPKTNSQI